MRKRDVVVVAAGVLAGMLAFESGVSAKEAVIGKHISIAGEDVSGMTEQEAEKVIDKIIKKYGKTKLTLVSGEKKVKVKAGKLDISCADDDLAGKALSFGKEGNLITRYEANQAIEEGTGRDYRVPVCGDSDSIREVIEDKKDGLDYDAVDNTVRPKDGKIKYIPGKDGHTVKVKKSVKAVEAFLMDGWSGEKGKIKLVTDVEKPGGDEKELKSIKSLLGTCDTDYSSSAEGRKENLANGAAKIDGTILYPGESLSVAGMLSPINSENGYALAPSYENGTTVNTYGGGICQVSSTLYNAVLRAELEVTERYPHSMMVHYLKPAKDAAIAVGSKDFKFKNNQKTPVYIEGTTDGSTIKFSIYGKETRPKNREVEFESKILATYAPGEETIVDPEAEPGSNNIKQYGHTGCDAELIKHVYIDGEEESSEIINRSSYSVSNTIYVTGP